MWRHAFVSDRFLYIGALTYPSALHVRCTVDTFDDYLEPLAGPRAGRNGVSASYISILPNPKSQSPCYLSVAPFVDGGTQDWRTRGHRPFSVLSGLQGGRLHHR